MSTKPYTPDEFELRDCYALRMAVYGVPLATAKTDAERGIAKIKAEAWGDAIDFVSRHYEDYLPLNWQSKADEESPRRIEEES